MILALGLKVNSSVMVYNNETTNNTELAFDKLALVTAIEVYNTVMEF